MLKNLQTIIFATKARDETANQSDIELNTYAILNAAKNEQLWMHLQSYNPEYRCLYNGADEIELAEVAPYLVKLEQEHPFTEWALINCYGDHCGSFMHSNEDIDSVADHFMHYTKTITLIEGQDREVYFNFYDPRVFPRYIKSRTKEKFQQFFTPINYWLMEDEDNPELLLRYSMTDKGWQVNTISLEKEA